MRSPGEFIVREGGYTLSMRDLTQILGGGGKAVYGV